MKHICKCYLLLILLLPLPLVSYTKPAYKTVLSKAEDAYFEDNFVLALKLYHQVLVREPDHIKANARLGDIYLELQQPDKAIIYLKKVTESTPKYNKEWQQQLAAAYQQNQQFDEAITQYFDLLKRVKRDTKTQGQYLKRLAECVAGKQLLAQPTSVKLQNLGAAINSASSDHGPVLTNADSTLIFTSRRPKGGKKIDIYSDEDIFFTHRKGTEWSVPARYGKPVNSMAHEAVLAVSPDGATLYLYRDNERGGDIYETRKEKNKTWKTPVKLGEPLNSKYYEPSVFISKDGQYAFFSSDRPGGFGGLDLYLSVRSPDGAWGEAMNLGSSINTPHDEDAPFLDAENITLYFSSKGHNSMGGYDVFWSVINGAIWSPAQNMGSPVNSPANDIFYVQTQEGKTAFLASDRPGGFGGSDIYMVEASESSLVAGVTSGAGTFTAMISSTNEPVFILPDIQTKAENTNTLTFTGWVTDAQTGDTLNAQVTLLNRELVEEETSSATKDAPFTFSVTKSKTYGLLVHQSGYAFLSQVLVVPESADRLPLDKPLKITRGTAEAAITLQNIAFYPDKDLLKSYSLAELEWLYHYLDDNPGTKVTFTNFINPEDKETNKQTLAAHRIKAICKYLAAKGIDTDRINEELTEKKVVASTLPAGLVVNVQSRKPHSK